MILLIEFMILMRLCINKLYLTIVEQPCYSALSGMLPIHSRISISFDALPVLL